MMDVHTLTTLQNERYNGFVRRAEMWRLLRVQDGTNNPPQLSATRPEPMHAAPTLYQVLVTTMQAHIRTLLSH